MHMLYVVGWVNGMTCLDNIMYVVVSGESTILLYNMVTYSRLDRVIKVDGMSHPTDIVVCRVDRQLYVADCDYCIWRVSADDDHSYVKWLPTESTTDTFRVDTLSLTSRRLLVTSFSPPGLRQYSTTDRQLLRVVPLPDCVKDLLHAVETTRQTFVVGHMDAVSELFRFCHALVISITIYYIDNTQLIAARR